jgi:hypothetical protein
MRSHWSSVSRIIRHLYRIDSSRQFEIGSSYSDELGTTANLRFQRILELPVYRKIWFNTRLAGYGEEGRWQRNTSVCEYGD